MKDETRTLYIQRSNDAWQKLTIPATAKVTFGPLIPGKAEGYDGGGRALFLRVYKSSNHQLACIPGVKQFRDADVLLADPGPDGFVVIDETELIGKSVETQLRADNNSGPPCPRCGWPTTELGANNRRRLMNGHTHRCTSSSCNWSG